MNDLIEKQDAIDAAIEAADEWDGGYSLTRAKMIENKLKDLPSVQPEIIHCKDCKYYIPYDWMFDGLTRSSNRNDYTPDEIGCAVNDHNYPPEGFCSNAERRTE